MNKSVTNIALTLFLTPMLMQCVAAEKEVKGLDLRLRTMDTRIVEMERTVTAMNNQRGSQAELALTVDELKTRMLQLEGQIDESTHQARRKQEDEAALRAGTDKRITELESNLSKLNTRIAELNTQLSDLQNRIGTVTVSIKEIQEDRAKEAADKAAAAARAAEEARQAVEKAAQPRTIEPVQTKKKPGTPDAVAAVPKQKEAEQKAAAEPAPAAGDGLYEKGLASFKAKKYQAAYNSFAEFLDKNPKDQMAPNARFWLGECLYKQKEYELAILEYQKVIADYPKSGKAPAALLKQGLAFEELAEKETAKIVYNKLLADYPKSDQVEAAKSRLAELK